MSSVITTRHEGNSQLEHQRINPQRVIKIFLSIQTNKLQYKTVVVWRSPRKGHHAVKLLRQNVSQCRVKKLANVQVVSK